MIRKRTPVSMLLLMVAGILASTPSPASALNNKVGVTEKNQPLAQADLLISQFAFPANNDKALRIHVANRGGSSSAHCILRLTIRKINGVPVGRVVEIQLPPLAAGKDKWVLINAKGLLPDNVSLESTTFKLNADATSVVTESNEANNEVWHNL